MRAFRPRHEHTALYGVTAEAISELVRVHVTTARRWKRGEEPPYAALKLIELLTVGDLGVIDPAWSGWILRDGMLHSPDNMSFAPGDIMAGPFWRTLAKSYQTEQRLPRQADWVSERWVVNEDQPAALAGP